MMYHTRKAVMLVVAAALTGLAYAQAPAWENLYPQFRGLAFGADKFVAVSEDGLIKTSSAGADWAQVFVSASGDTRKITAVANGGGWFVALDGGSTFLHSEDGASWGSSGTGESFIGTYITHGPGGFVAVDNEGYTIRYNDGWNVVQAPNATDYFTHIAYGAPSASEGRYVAVGRGSVGIASTTNAVWWYPATSSPSNVNAVAFGDDKFVAVSTNGANAYTSSNGTDWTTAQVSGVPANIADMTYGGGKFVAVGANGLGASSSNGTSWTSFTLNANDNFRAVKYGNNTFMALGANGSVYTSADGVSWSQKANGYAMSYKQIVYGGGKFVAVGDSGAAVSSDGKAWSRRSAGKGLVAVAFGEGKGFVAVGDSGALWTSADGEAWASQSENFSNTMLTAVAYGGGKFIIGGRTYGAAGAMIVIQTSPTGKAPWDDLSLDQTGWSTTTQYPTTLCFGGPGGGKIVAGSGNIGTLGTGGSAEIMHSDGSNANLGLYWSRAATMPTEANNYRIATVTYAVDRFVALGISGVNDAIVLHSSDGNTWAAIPGIVPGGKSVTYASGFFIVAADKGHVYASNGGVWHLQPRATNRNLQTIYAGNGAIIAAGAAGAILHSTATPTSINHKAAPRVSASSKNGAMRIDQSRRAPVVTLSFTPNRAGTIAIYSLTGKQLYKQRLMAGERSVQLPERLKISNSSVIVRYTGEGKAVSQRFQFVR